MSAPTLEPAWRRKIATGQVANRLLKFIDGEITMNAAQVTAALGLMKKVVPDLQSQEINNKLSGKITLSWEE